jgi:hypothetical protein
LEYWHCRNGYDWVADKKRWSAALMAAVCARPACPLCGGPSAQLLSPSDPDLEWWTDDLAAGVAVIADADADVGRFYLRRCHDCRHVW